LLDEDRAAQQNVQQEVALLKSELMVPEKFNQRVEPYFEEKIKYLQKNFPTLFGPFLSSAIAIQIRDSQDEIIEALYPIIGKLIRRYIAVEISQLGERLDAQLQQTLSPEAWWERLVALFKGESYDNRIMKKVAKASIEEIFVIDKDSGLLLGNYSFNNLIDADMIAGMLTGIKAFVEQAFMQGTQELQSLEYDKYKLLVHNFHTYYCVFVISGILSPDFESRITDTLLEFTSKYPLKPNVEVTHTLTEEISTQLKSVFVNFNESQ
jgi:hypothetical protein